MILSIYHKDLVVKLFKVGRTKGVYLYEYMKF